MVAAINKPLRVPALRARMGDWVYYTCTLKMGDIAKRIKYASELFTSKVLEETVQRKLTNRAGDISRYLTSQPQRFFNAIVVGTYGGDPKWYEIDIREFEASEDVLPDYVEGVFGILQLEHDAEIWAIDGQHRVAGIRQAVLDAPTLADEEVSVIFVAGVTSKHRMEDPVGFERTRRLFTTLNRHARPVSKSDIVILDENDTIAIITRRLVEEHPLFQEKVAIGQTKSIPTSDQQNFTTIEMLYDVMDVYLKDKKTSDWKFFKEMNRPEDDILATYHQRGVELWNTLIDQNPLIQDFSREEAQQGIAHQYRHGAGGNLLFRPIGLLVFIRALRMLLDSDQSLQVAMQHLHQVPQEISQPPWDNLLWDTTNARMLTAQENQRVAQRLLFYAVGGDLEQINTNIEKLQNEYAGILNKPVDEVTIRRYA